MPDTFTPLTPALFAGRNGAASNPGNFAAAGKSANFEPLGVPGAGHAAAVACASKPIVTLQRAGNVVTSIRVQCGCGQVVELNCQY